MKTETIICIGVGYLSSYLIHNAFPKNLILSNNNLSKISEKDIQKYIPKTYSGNKTINLKERTKIIDAILKGDFFQQWDGYEKTNCIIIDKPLKEHSLVFFSVDNGYFSTTSAETVSTYIYNKNDHKALFRITFSANSENVIDGYYTFEIVYNKDDNYTLTYIKHQKQNHSWLSSLMVSDETYNKWSEESVEKTLNYLISLE